MNRIILGAVAALLAATAAAGPPLNLKLKDLDGKRVALVSTLAKGPAVFSFWATWCYPCQEELIHMQRLSQVYRDSGVSFVAISIDDAKTAGRVKALVAGRKFDFQVLLDQEQQAMRAFGLTDVPGLFVLKQDGTASFEHRGYKAGDEVAIEEAIKEVIPRPQSPPDSAGAGAQ